MAESLESQKQAAVSATASSAPALNGYIDAEQVRTFMASARPRASHSLIDYQYSAEDIAEAMKAAARRYNSVLPLVGSADPTRLPANTNVFFDAIAAELFYREIRVLTTRDIDYTSGGVSTNLVSRRIQHLERMADRHVKDFTRAASDLKRVRNLRNAFRRF